MDFSAPRMLGMGSRAPGEREREREAPSLRAGSRGAAGGTKIKVCNVPKNLDSRDIKEAFEDTGRVLRCEVERGVANIIFSTLNDAKKAVTTFDRGELNGQTIFVTLEQ